jgi:1,4-alpha-glucan branching enzyme
MAKKIKSKTIEPKTEQTFVLNAGAAQSVELVGDFTGWQENPIPLELQADGNWQVTVQLAPGQYNYLFLVDGEWCDDPACAMQIPNPYGGRNCVRQVV